MKYIKSVEENKWRRWKAAEETKLRELGVDEEVIERLRVSDWEDFKAERIYRMRQTAEQEYTEQQAATETCKIPINVEDLLASIENEQLLKVLMKTDKITLQILLLKSFSLSSKEIAQKLGISVNAVDHRVCRIKEKIKNIF